MCDIFCLMVLVPNPQNICIFVLSFGSALTLATGIPFRVAGAAIAAGALVVGLLQGRPRPRAAAAQQAAASWH